MRRSRGSPLQAVLLGGVLLVLWLIPADWLPGWVAADWFEWLIVAAFALFLLWGLYAMLTLTREAKKLIDEIPDDSVELGESRVPAEAMYAVDAFDEAIHDASGVPFTDQVRLDRGKADRLLERLRTALPRGDASLGALLFELDELIRNAKPIPLTNEIRLDRDAVYDIVDRMRASFAEGR